MQHVMHGAEKVPDRGPKPIHPPDATRKILDCLGLPSRPPSVSPARLIRERRTVYDCTEAVFWKCHRQLVSDALLIRGFRIGHILGRDKVQAHELTSFAKAEGENITYPA